MDTLHFDELARAFAGATSRRSLLRALVGGVGASGALAAGRRFGSPQIAEARHKKKHCSSSRKCERFCCAKGTFCCDPASKTCCADGEACCNAGSGHGSCCAAPNACADPYGNDAAPAECCPPERTWTSDVGVSRCCPEGSHALPNGGSSTNGGPCCPVASYCDGHCCAEGASCIDNQCCGGQQVCADVCCADGDICCNNRCYAASRNPHPCGSTGCCFGNEVCCKGPYNPEPGCVPAGSCDSPA